MGVIRDTSWRFGFWDLEWGICWQGAMVTLQSAKRACLGCAGAGIAVSIFCMTCMNGQCYLAS